MVQELCSVLGQRVFLPSPSPSSDGSEQLGNEENANVFLDPVCLLILATWMRVFQDTTSSLRSPMAKPLYQCTLFYVVCTEIPMMPIVAACKASVRGIS